MFQWAYAQVLDGRPDRVVLERAEALQAHRYYYCRIGTARPWDLSVDCHFPRSLCTPHHIIMLHALRGFSHEGLLPAIAYASISWCWATNRHHCTRRSPKKADLTVA